MAADNCHHMYLQEHSDVMAVGLVPIARHKKIIEVLFKSKAVKNQIATTIRKKENYTKTCNSPDNIAEKNQPCHIWTDQHHALVHVESSQKP